ncbi:MAG TPA: hypothetical protein VFK56_08455, partial [Mycobacterium sp.]|nr:hypothetical protein [Mycobacterium sp.]
VRQLGPGPADDSADLCVLRVRIPLRLSSARRACGSWFTTRQLGNNFAQSDTEGGRAAGIYFPPSELMWHLRRTEPGMSVKKVSTFTAACQEAANAVLAAIGAVGDERRGHLAEARLAVDRAMHNAHSGDEWFLADHLRRGIKEVEASRDAA